MRHRWFFSPRFHRDAEHRAAMVRNMVTSLILHERIITTHAKAKYAQRFAEQMVAAARRGGLRDKEEIHGFVRTDEARKKLFTILKARYEFRPCGFTRVIHVKRRRGDNAELSYLEFVDRPGEIRPSVIQTPQTYQQVLALRKINEERQKAEKI